MLRLSRLASLGPIALAIGVVLITPRAPNSAFPPLASFGMITAYALLVIAILVRVRPETLGTMTNDEFRRHVLRLANRIHDCDPVDVKYGKLTAWSPFGTSTTATRQLERLSRQRW